MSNGYNPNYRHSLTGKTSTLELAEAEPMVSADVWLTLFKYEKVMVEDFLTADEHHLSQMSNVDPKRLHNLSIALGRAVGAISPETRKRIYAGARAWDNHSVAELFRPRN